MTVVLLLNNAKQEYFSRYIQYLNLSPMFIYRIFIPQLCLCKMPVVEELFCYILSLTGIHCRKVHDYTNLIHKRKADLNMRSTSNSLKNIIYTAHIPDPCIDLILSRKERLRSLVTSTLKKLIIVLSFKHWCRRLYKIPNILLQVQDEGGKCGKKLV